MDRIDKILERINNKQNVLIVGAGGCGKSFTLINLVQILKEQDKSVYVTATTGVAALNLGEKNNINVTTVHRFAGVGTAQVSVKELLIRMKFQARERWLKCQVLIIDEISMLGGSFFQKLDNIAKTIRNNSKPFGGIQVIASGDFAQLPPVKDIWVFKTDEWKSMEFTPFILDKPYRYDNIDFFNMLSRIRVGTVTDEDYKILKARVRANHRLQELLLKISSEKAGEVIKPTMFYAKRCNVDIFNQRELDKLPGETVTFTAVDEFQIKKGNPVKEDYIKLLDEDIPQSISFKVGAQVMLKHNLDVDAGLVNGSRGVVNEIVPGEALIVKFLNGIKLRVELLKRVIETKKAIASRTQIPFILAWSSTIHKSQSISVDYMVVDLGPDIFSDGQAYVALSRCRKIEGLFISELSKSHITANQEALEYMEHLAEIAK